MSSRHVFLQRASTRGLDTSDQRADHHAPDRGTVEEARYMRWQPQGFFERIFGLRRPREATELRFVLPFDAAGRDVLALSEPHPLLEGDDDPVGTLRRVRGTIICLEPRTPGDDVVLRDIWIEHPPIVRLVESIDFGILPSSGAPVAVCCAMAPLVIARPETTSVEAFTAELGQRASSLLLRHADRSHTGSGLRLRAGEEVEVIGLVCDPAASTQRFDATARSAPYRGAPRPIDLIVGDEPGTRLVIRR